MQAIQNWQKEILELQNTANKVKKSERGHLQQDSLNRRIRELEDGLLEIHSGNENVDWEPNKEERERCWTDRTLRHFKAIIWNNDIQVGRENDKCV